MLRIAVPNKGSLSETASEMLLEAGYTGRRDPRALSVRDDRNDVEFFYLRPRDIATYVGSGALDVGITGRDLLLDSRSAAAEIASLDFGESTFRFAGPPGAFADLAALAGGKGGGKPDQARGAAPDRTKLTELQAAARARL